jgi:hypothetical protein
MYPNITQFETRQLELERTLRLSRDLRRSRETRRDTNERRQSHQAGTPTVHAMEAEAIRP